MVVREPLGEISDSLQNGKVEIPIIDRGRLSRGQLKQMTVLGMKLQQANKVGDADEVGRLLDEIDALVELAVIDVPREWFVEGTPPNVKVGTPGWIDRLRGDKYDELVAASAGTPGRKGG